MDSETDKAREAFLAEIDAFVTELVGSGRFLPYLKPSMVVGGVLLLDRIAIDDPPDSEGWYSIAQKPGQRGNSSIGLIEQCRARMLGAYIGQGIDEGRDDVEGDS